jgi:hypothetical protein
MDKKKKPYKAPTLTKYGSMVRITQFSFDLGPGDWLNCILPIDLCPWPGCTS